MNNLDLYDLHLRHQPIINLDTCSVIGTEALLRMKTESGLLTPKFFMDRIKSRINDLSLFQWVLIEAINHIVYFKQRNVDIKVSVNVSADEILNPYFFNLLEEIFEDPESKNLVLEITERKTLVKENNLSTILDKIKNIGITTSIDNFGRAMSNFDRLLLYPFDNVKIDKLFVKNIAHSKYYRDILKSMIDLIVMVDKTPIVEGVESLEQAEIIRELGCNRIQGYCITAPLNYKDIPMWLAKSHYSKDWWTLPSDLFSNLIGTTKIHELKMIT